MKSNIHVRASVQLPEGLVIGPFLPHTSYNVAFDWFTYLEKDCSIMERKVPNSNIVLLHDNADDKVVGVRIEHYSEAAALHVVI